MFKDISDEETNRKMGIVNERFEELVKILFEKYEGVKFYFREPPNPYLAHLYKTDDELRNIPFDVLVNAMGGCTLSRKAGYEGPLSCKSEAEIEATCLKIIGILKGYPLGQAVYAIEHAKDLLLDSHNVDDENPRLFARKIGVFDGV